MNMQRANDFSKVFKNKVRKSDTICANNNLKKKTISLFNERT